MTDATRPPAQLDPNGFNELSSSRSGPMLYNKNDVYVGGSLRKYGEFSTEEGNIFRQIVKPGMTVVEVGANIGAHTVDLARLVGMQGRVYAFEPQRLVFQTLCANLALNQIRNVYAYLMAVGSAPGEISVPAPDPTVPENFGGVSLLGASEGEVVPITPLDSLALPGCNFLKVDVEGMEVDVLLGAVNTIEAHRPLLYLENDRADRSEELLGTIGTLGYTAYWHFAPLFNPHNFAGDAENIFPNTVSINVLCLPNESARHLEGLLPASSTSETWEEALKRAFAINSAIPETPK